MLELIHRVAEAAIIVWGFTADIDIAAWANRLTHRHSKKER
jgi:hypothetical protein